MIGGKSGRCRGSMRSCLERASDAEVLFELARSGHFSAPSLRSFAVTGSRQATNCASKRLPACRFSGLHLQVKGNSALWLSRGPESSSDHAHLGTPPSILDAFLVLIAVCLPLLPHCSFTYLLITNDNSFRRIFIIPLTFKIALCTTRPFYVRI